MTTSQNGWSVYTSSGELAPLPWITGRVRPGAVWTVFDYLCRRFDREVERIDPKASWGYAYRAVRGQSSGYSNHASATAVDLNAPRHPLGARGTFNRGQVTAIRRILADLDGVVRWGGDYRNRADEMHFEINADAAAVRRVAEKVSRPVSQPVTSFRPFPSVDRVAWNMKVGRRAGVAEALDALAASGARLIGLMECLGHWPVIRSWAKSRGWSIITGVGDPGSSSAYLVRHRTGHVSGGTITIPTRWRGPKGRRIPGRTIVWEKSIDDGRPTLDVLVHGVWNPVLNFLANRRIHLEIRRLAEINPGWDMYVRGDLNARADSRRPFSPLGTANKIGAEIVPTGALVDLVMFRPAPKPIGGVIRRKVPRPVAVKGGKYGSDHPAVGTRNRKAS